MTKKTQSKTMKIALAAVMATSIALPTFAQTASASTSTVVTTTAEQQVTAQQVQEEAVTFHTFKSNTKVPEPGISNQISTQGKIIVKEGTTYAQLTVPARSASMIPTIQIKQGNEFVDAVKTVHEDNTATFEFPLTEGVTTPSKLHVYAEFSGGIHEQWYEYDLVATANTQIAPLTIYQDGKTEESIMKNYVASDVNVTKKGEKYVITLASEFGKNIKSFAVNGENTQLVSEKDNNKTFTFEVDNPKELIDAELHIVVDEAGVKYDTKHKVQFSIGVKGAINPVVNPFSDITTNNNKMAILALNSKGIVKSGTKYNPSNNISRSQFALMVARALNITSAPNAGFKDLGAITDEERLTAINALAHAGVVQKVDNFNPNNQLTRQQGALMLYRAMNYSAKGTFTSGDTELPFYVDANEVTDKEAQQAFAFLYSEGIMTGSPQKDGTVKINPNSSLTRSQMAKILYGSLEIIEN